MASLRDIIIRPVITEKTNGLMAEGKYTFVVDPRASKGVIKQAIEDKFKVKVKDVNTSRVQGKIRRMGRHVGRQPSWKKAVVTLEAGQKIEFFEGM
ncbi:MAG: 50S ribosomal protein L23 [Firmicutes bacterium]|nr:50S ribosomal protein L23 [Bacillota bacterium]MCL5038562.1 50S ribosomal protein L23 [Bacillota bacterium]